MTSTVNFTKWKRHTRVQSSFSEFRFYCLFQFKALSRSTNSLASTSMEQVNKLSSIIHLFEADILQPVKLTVGFTAKMCRLSIEKLYINSSLVINQITVGSFASHFNCTPVGRASDSMIGQT